MYTWRVASRKAREAHINALRGITFFDVFLQVNDFFEDAYHMFISMTSLFAHKVAQPTKSRFLPKNLSQLVIFVIGLAITWVCGDKNRAQF